MFSTYLGFVLIFFLSIQVHVGQAEGRLTPFKETDDFIADDGYMPERHKTTTVDGYILTMFRIPYGLAGPSMEPRPAILLIAGVGQNSDQWVQIGNNSLPYLLANEGYDVWMGNLRGSEYGAENLYYPITSKKFWDYSYHENGIYDLPAIIDYVLKKTGQPNLIYLGHSKGTTSFFVLLSLLPKYNEKISLGIMYAPVMDAKGTNSLPFLIGTYIYKAGVTDKILSSLGIYELLFLDDFMRLARFFICNEYSLFKQLCWDSLFILSGFDYSNERNLTHSGRLFSHILGAIGVKDYFHAIQSVQTGRFAQYNYGSKKNLEIYKRLIPPRYHVENIKVPLFLTCADNDFIVSKKVFKSVTKRLRTPYKKYHVPYKTFNHADYPLGTDPELVYIPTINYIKEFFGTS